VDGGAWPQRASAAEKQGGTEGREQTGS
jgi:hypothetical protein